MDKRLIIIDGNSIINRAFFALPEMNNKEGLKTNAIYGFTTMLFKIIIISQGGERLMGFLELRQEPGVCGSLNILWHCLSLGLE